VHRNSMYHTFTEAMEEPRGLATIAMLHRNVKNNREHSDTFLPVKTKLNIIFSLVQFDLENGESD